MKPFETYLAEKGINIHELGWRDWEYIEHVDAHSSLCVEEVLKEVVAMIDRLPRVMFRPERADDHEYIDTCLVYVS